MCKEQAAERQLSRVADARLTRLPRTSQSFRECLRDRDGGLQDRVRGDGRSRIVRSFIPAGATEILATRQVAKRIVHITEMWERCTKGEGGQRICLGDTAPLRTVLYLKILPEGKASVVPIFGRLNLWSKHCERSCNALLAFAWWSRFVEALVFTPWSFVVQSSFAWPSSASPPKR